MDLPIDSMVIFHSFLLTFTRGYPRAIFFQKGEDQGFFRSEQVAFPRLSKRLQEGI